MPVRRILKEIGIENVYVVTEQELPDPQFLHRASVPNPEDPAAFDAGHEAGRRGWARTACFGTDPDCDRVGIAVQRTTRRRYYLMTGNQIGCVLLYYILTQQQGAGQRSRQTARWSSPSSPPSWRARSRRASACVCFDTLTGFKWIAEKIQQFQENGRPHLRLRL